MHAIIIQTNGMIHQGTTDRSLILIKMITSQKIVTEPNIPKTKKINKNGVEINSCRLVTDKKRQSDALAYQRINRRERPQCNV